MKKTNSLVLITLAILIVVASLWKVAEFIIETDRQQKPAANSNGHILFFFRVPKTGSEMTTLLLQWLQGANQFRHVRLRNTNHRRLDKEEQEELRKEVDDILLQSHPLPVAFDRHVYFTDLKSDVNKRIRYFSAIRDPVERIVSQFYYARTTPRPGLILPPNVTTPQPSNSI